ncbi:MAG: 4Fe-4S binding protein [Planctomycetota bacterium]|nr:MAG: 4Fe-4S binding protein [Planctomycetota bacterium]
MHRARARIALQDEASPATRVSPAGAPDRGPLLAPESRVLATLAADGTRRWIRPRLSPNVWWQRRRITAWTLMLLYSVIPWTTWGGMPTVLLDIVERKAVFFGTVFRPTETLLFALASLAVFVVIFLLTAVLGRVWCGWACPQTVYMEFLYRPLERVFLGRAALNSKAIIAPWRRVALGAAYVLVSAHLANTLLAWFVGAPRLSEWIFTSSPAAHPTAFAVFAVVTALMLLNFAFFREQTCSIMCPYGRLQSALIDRNSLVIGYDSRRGEPRGKAGSAPRTREHSSCSGKCGCDGNGGCGSGSGCGGDHHSHDHPHDHHGHDSEEHDHDHEHAFADPHRVQLNVLRRSPALAAPRGDCIDCTMCVQTCPAGIDIRDGVQLECIACAQCIDACDAVMARIGKPLGLIRYASQRALRGESTRKFRARLVVYPVMLAILVAFIAVIIATRKSAFVAVLRTQGIPYVMHSAGSIDERVESVVRLRIDNRRRSTASYMVSGDEHVTLGRDAEVEIAGDSSGIVEVLVHSTAAEFVRGRREITLFVHDTVGDAAQFRDTVTTHVLGPWTLAPLNLESSHP